MRARSRRPTRDGSSDSVPSLRFGLDAVEQLAGFLGRQHGRLALPDDVFGAAHGVGRVHVENVARHQPVEQHPERRQVLLDGRRGELALQVLDEGGDVEGLDVGQTSDAVGVAPLGEASRRVAFRYALRVWSLLICAVKNSRTRLAAWGVGVNSGAG